MSSGRHGLASSSSGMQRAFPALIKLDLVLVRKSAQANSGNPELVVAATPTPSYPGLHPSTPSLTPSMLELPTLPSATRTKLDGRHFHAGLIQPTLLADGQVRVNMGPPTLGAADVPTTLEPTRPDGSVVAQVRACVPEARFHAGDAERQRLGGCIAEQAPFDWSVQSPDCRSVPHRISLGNHHCR